MPYANPEDQKRTAKAHYEANKEVYKARAAAHRKKNREAIKVLLREAKNRPCADCDAQYPYYVMQFDHAPGEKEFTIGSVAQRNLTLSRIAAEIARCEVVCANCHAERTHQRGQAYSIRLVSVSAVGEADDVTLF